MGDKKADIVLEAFSYRVAKEIGAYATVLKGEVDGIVLTGGIAHSKRITESIEERVKYIAPVHIFPGENEMEAMCQGALRVLRGIEKAKEY
jgi:butyrate kinase